MNTVDITTSDKQNNDILSGILRTAVLQKTYTYLQVMKQQIRIKLRYFSSLLSE